MVPGPGPANLPRSGKVADRNPAVDVRTQDVRIRSPARLCAYSWCVTSEVAPMSASLAIRTDPSNPDHHMWLNNGTWWCHFTMHLPGNRARRVRRSLGTRDHALARSRRDRLFRRLECGTAGGRS